MLINFYVMLKCGVCIGCDIDIFINYSQNEHAKYATHFTR
jgi:Ni,Fe-hydrogenase III small subunit